MPYAKNFRAMERLKLLCDLSESSVLGLPTLLQCHTTLGSLRCPFKRPLETHFLYAGNQSVSLNPEKLRSAVATFNFPSGLLQNS